MSKNCETVYLDEKGNKASAYYNVLEEKGEAEALRSYLSYMSNKIPYKKSGDFEEMISSQSKFEKAKYQGITSVMKDIELDSDIENSKNGNTEDKLAFDVALKMKARDIMIKNPDIYDISNELLNNVTLGIDKITLSDNALKEAQTFYNEHEAQLKLDINAIKENWKFHKNAGIEIHNFIEKFYSEFNNKRSKESGDPVIEDIFNEYMNFDSVGERKSDIVKTLISVHKTIKNLIDEKGIKNYEIKPEFKVTNDVLKMKVVMDLVIHDKDNNKILIIDFKFKEEGKEFLFDTKSFGRMAGVFNGMFNNKKSQAEIQLSVYKLIFEKAGFTSNNIETFILPITAKPLKDELGKRIGYEKMFANKLIPTTYQRSMLGKYFKSKSINIDKEAVLEEGKFNSAHDVINDLSNSKYNDVSYNPDKLAEKYLNKKIPVDESTGKEYFMDTINNKRVLFNSTDYSTRKKQLVDFYKRRLEDSDRLSNDIISYYNNLKNDINSPFPGPPSIYLDAVESQVKNILQGIIEQDYSIEQLKNINGFENENPNILLAKNNKTGNAKLFYVLREIDKDIRFDNKNTTVFGKYIKDKTIEYTHYIKGMDSKTSNYKLLEAGLLGLRLRNNNYINSIESITSVVVNGNLQTGGVPNVAYMSDILPQIKLIPEFTKGNLSTELKELFDNKALMNEDYYKSDYISELMDLVQSSIDFKPLKKDDFNKKIKNSFDVYKATQSNKIEMLKMLYQAQNIMYSSLRKTIPPNNPGLLSKNKSWSLLCNAILQISDISFDSGALSRRRKTGLDSDALKLYGNYDSSVIQELYSLDQSTQLETKRKFNEFKFKHTDIVERLKKEFYSSSKSLHLKSDLSEVFKNLFQEDPDIKEKDLSKTFKLKDENDNSLTSTQKEYIKFFNDNMKQGFSYTLSSDQVKNLDKTWENGTVPIAVASVSSRISKAQSINDKFKLHLKNLQYQGVKKSKDIVDELFYMIQNNYESQLKQDNYVQGSAKRRELLNIDENGEAIKDKEPLDLESNLESILNNFMADSITQLSYEPTFAIFNAIQVKLFLEQNENFKPTEDLRKAIDTYIKVNIFNQYNDDGKVGKFLDVTKNIANKLVMGGIGGSPRQVLQETGQNFLAHQSMIMNNLVASAFKDDSAFLKNPVSSSLAANKYSFSSEKISERNAQIAMFISEDFGLFDGDLNSMKSDDFLETRKGGLFQSKWMMFLNSKPYRHFYSHAFFTKLIDDGIMNAYVTKGGAVEYDPTLDKRFDKIFDNKGELKNNLKSDEEKLQLAFYNSILKDLKSENNGIKSNGKINRPYSNLEIVAMKDYFMKSFGSMNRNSKVEAHQSSMWRMIMTYKNWFLAKKDNYWTESELRLSKGKRVLVKNEETGELFYEFRPQLDEGIIQTLQFAFVQFSSAMKDSNYKKISYSATQKDNLRRFASDLVLLSIMTLIMLGLKDSLSDEKGKYFYRIAESAISDLNIFLATDSVVNGNPIALYGFVVRLGQSVTSAVSYGIDGDYENALRQGSKVSGFTKFAFNIAQ